MKAKIVNITQETPLVRTLTLETEEKINFKPGQFIMVILNDNDKVIRRAYSISHYQEQPTNKITISLNETPNGNMSSFLFNSKVNDTLEIDGPHGLFTLQETNNPKLFIAAGTGITPLMTMIESLENCEMDQTLIYSSKKEELILFNDRLNQIANLNFIPTLTQETWDGHNGRITKELIENNLREGSEIYICGMPEFVKRITSFLEELNVESSRIHTERW